MADIIKTSRKNPQKCLDEKYRYETFGCSEPFDNKTINRLPAMGWNSWNAFGSQNTEELTKIMADKLVELELDKAGYKYVVLDDGCYMAERVDGKLTNEPVKFPNGFRSLADYIHSKGLKYGMYNDIGTNLCAGSAVGTCGFEDVDAKSYIDWDVDFLKVDNCYYLWDNATFSNPENAKYTYAPNIKSIHITGSSYDKNLSAESDGILEGRGAYIHDNGYATNIGTFDGTNVGNTPVGAQSSELIFNIDVPETGEYSVSLEYAAGKEVGVGQWLQIAIDDGKAEKRIYDDFVAETDDTEVFVFSEEIRCNLSAGKHRIRIMNHRRQENVLVSYAAMFNALKEMSETKDIVLSICEWGKTMPNNWGYKVGDSWRILNDISFQVGSPEHAGKASWTDPGTPSITSQYDKAVIMDEYAGLKKGWNDPDMLVIGMDGITYEMVKTHMTMWCMMNSPLMLGMDLRTVNKGDDIWKIISNADLIALNQDALGIQAKRVFSSLVANEPDTAYITNHERVDILAKPLSNGDIAVSFINLSDENTETDIKIDLDTILSFIGTKMVDKSKFENANRYRIVDLWSKEEWITEKSVFSVNELLPHDNVTIRISVED